MPATMNMSPAQKDFWAGLMFIVAGIAFAWGATNYSFGQSARPGPGYFPFGLGLLLAVLGGALARGDLRGIVAVALATWAFWRKLRIEERWMREQFGAAYEEYSRRVAALIPFVV